MIGNGFTQRELDAMARENEARKAHDLTPSEVALARVLAAWEEWGQIHDKGRARHAMSAVWEALVNSGYVLGLALTDDGAALLARARKAGVL